MDTRSGSLRRLAPIVVEPAALRLVETLLRSPGETVSSETLLVQICGRADADPANVRIAASKLRYALGDKDFELVVTGKGGYRLAAPVTWYDAPSPRYGPRWAKLALLAAIGGALASLVYVRSFRPFVTVTAPARIETHEALVFGECRSELDDEVVVYVHPDDRQALYWPQPRVRRESATGSWQGSARFGNEEGIDMRVPPPLAFDVVAALVPAAVRDRFPIDGEGGPITARSFRAFRAALLDRGARAVSAPVRVQRDPEPACARQMVKLVSPSDAGDEAARTLVPPIRLAWLPAEPMYATLWREGVAVPALPAAGRIPSGTLIDLEPGTYQLKVAPVMADGMLRCATSAWFVVAAAASP